MLGRDYVVGRMGSDTFEARLDRAFAARSRSDLLLLRDAGSTNGTRDGAWRVAEIEVDAGSELRLGDVLVRFYP